jgi:putative ABC transport system permease protein
MVWESRPREGIDDNVVSPADFLDWRARQRVFASMAAAIPTTLTLSGSGEPEQLSASSVSAAFFSVLGVVPILGRDFTVEEEQAGRNRVVMLTHGLWQRRFAGTRDIVGTRITLSGELYEVIGVLPASFRYGEQTVSVFSPIDFSTEDMRARFNHLRCSRA